MKFISYEVYFTLERGIILRRHSCIAPIAKRILKKAIIEEQRKKEDLIFIRAANLTGSGFAEIVFYCLD